MLKMLKGFVLGVLVAVLAIGGLAGTHRLVHTSSGLRLVRRSQVGFGDVYVDVRQWGLLEYARNSEIAKELAADGLEDARQALRGKLREVEDGLEAARERVRKTLDAAPEPSEK